MPISNCPKSAMHLKRMCTYWNCGVLLISDVANSILNLANGVLIPDMYNDYVTAIDSISHDEHKYHHASDAVLCRTQTPANINNIIRLIHCGLAVIMNFWIGTQIRAGSCLHQKQNKYKLFMSITSSHSPDHAHKKARLRLNLQQISRYGRWVFFHA